MIKRRGETSYLFFSSRFGLIKKCLWLKSTISYLLMFSYKKKEEELMPESGIRWIFWEENFGKKEDFLILLLWRRCLGKIAPSFLRGLFEARGYISDPLRHYHLEIGPLSPDLVNLVLEHLEERNLSFSFGN